MFYKKMLQSTSKNIKPIGLFCKEMIYQELSKN